MNNDNPITYKAIIDRCKGDAIDGLPDFPKAGDIDSWENYINELDDFEVFDYCHETVGNWDWSIYTHYGWKILHALPQSIIDDAEQQFLDINGGMAIEDTCGGMFDIWTIQSQIAYHACVALLTEQVQETVEELRAVAQTSIDNQ